MSTLETSSPCTPNFFAATHAKNAHTQSSWGCPCFPALPDPQTRRTQTPAAGVCTVQVSGERERAPPRPKPRRRPAWQSVSQTRTARDDDRPRTLPRPTRERRQWPRLADPIRPTEPHRPRRVRARNPSPSQYGRNPSATPTARQAAPARAAADNPTGADDLDRRPRTAAAATRHRARRTHSHTHTPTTAAMVTTAAVVHSVTGSQ